VTRTSWRWLLAAAVAVQLVVLYWPRPVDTGGGVGIDKVVHAALFAVVALTGRRAGVPPAWLAGLLLAHAVLSELLQHLVLPNRSGDPWDALADAVGVLVGMLLPLPRGADDPALPAR
jgi:hypothetical protein